MSKTTHRHVCACGTELRCAAEPDKCAVPSEFICPTCEEQERDAYFEHMERQSLTINGDTKR